MPLLEQDRNMTDATIRAGQEHFSSFLVFSVVRVVRVLFFCFMFCKSLFVLLSFFFCSLYCIVCLCDFLITLLVSSKLPGFYAFLKYYIHDHLHWRLFMFVMYYSYSLAMIDIKKQLLLFITSNYHLWFLQDCSYLTKLIIIRTNVMFSQYSVRVLIPFHIIYSKVNFITMTH